MVKKELLILIVSLGLLLTVGAAVVVLRRQEAKPLPSSSSEEAPSPTEVSPEENKVVLDETKTSSGQTFKAISGQLVSVEGRTLVLDSQGDRLAIEVAEDARLTKTLLPDQPGSAPKVEETVLSQLQIGDKVDALVKVEDNRAVATNINVTSGLR